MVKRLILFLVLVLAALAVGGYLYWRNVLSQKPEAVQERAIETAEEIISETPSIEVPTNPLEENVPELNPIEQTNPFSQYQNPFE
jgi:hypothetical protein